MRPRRQLRRIGETVEADNKHGSPCRYRRRRNARGKPAATGENAQCRPGLWISFGRGAAHGNHAETIMRP
jgi:hypothetical protein